MQQLQFQGGQVSALGREFLRADVTDRPPPEIWALLTEDQKQNYSASGRLLQSAMKLWLPYVNAQMDARQFQCVLDIVTHLLLAPSSETDTDEYELSKYPPPPKDKKQLQSLLSRAYDVRNKLVRSCGFAPLRAVGLSD